MSLQSKLIVIAVNHLLTVPESQQVQPRLFLQAEFYVVSQKWALLLALDANIVPEYDFL